MSYRIDYPQSVEMPTKRKRSFKLPALTLLFFLSFLLLTACFWNQGAQALRSFVLPGDAAVTAAALQDLTAALKTGEPFVNAFADFCHQVIQGAGIYLC